MKEFLAGFIIAGMYAFIDTLMRFRPIMRSGVKLWVKVTPVVIAAVYLAALGLLTYFMFAAPN